MNRPGTYHPRHLAPSPSPSPYHSVRQGWGEARPSATQVLTTLLVGLFLLCGIYQFAAAGLGPVRHGAHPAPSTAQGQASTASQSAQEGLSGHEGAATHRTHRTHRTPAQGEAGAPSSRQEGTQQPEPPLPLLDPSVGRGADSPTCKHAARSPRCRLEGGSGLSVPTNRSPRARGLALAPATDDGQTLLLDRSQGGEETFGPTHPQRMPHRVPGRGGWVSEQGPSAA